MPRAAANNRLFLFLKTFCCVARAKSPALDPSPVQMIENRSNSGFLPRATQPVKPLKFK